MLCPHFPTCPTLFSLILSSSCPTWPGSGPLVTLSLEYLFGLPPSDCGSVSPSLLSLPFHFLPSMPSLCSLPVSLRLLSLDLTKDSIRTHLQAHNCPLFNVEAFRNIMKRDKLLNTAPEMASFVAIQIACRFSIHPLSTLFYDLFYRQTWGDTRILN